MGARLIVCVSERLRVYRRERGLSQEEAAHIIGCSIPTYRALEQYSPRTSPKVPNPKLSTIMRVLDVLELDQPIVRALQEAREIVPTDGPGADAAT